MCAMQLLKVLFFLVICLYWLPQVAEAKDKYDAEWFVQALQQSHIEGNIPANEKDFHRILQADLTAYFTKLKGNRTQVQYELLRKAPTQSGVGYPHYYLWVKIIGNQLFDQGAVRVDAVDRLHFVVTDFVSRRQIIDNPSAIESIFPQLLCPLIREKAQAKI